MIGAALAVTGVVSFVIVSAGSVTTYSPKGSAVVAAGWWTRPSWYCDLRRAAARGRLRCDAYATAAATAFGLVFGPGPRRLAERHVRRGRAARHRDAPRRRRDPLCHRGWRLARPAGLRGRRPRRRRRLPDRGRSDAPCSSARGCSGRAPHPARARARTASRPLRPSPESSLSASTTPTARSSPDRSRPPPRDEPAVTHDLHNRLSPISTPQARGRPGVGPPPAHLPGRAATRHSSSPRRIREAGALTRTAASRPVRADRPAGPDSASALEREGARVDRALEPADWSTSCTCRATSGALARQGYAPRDGSGPAHAAHQREPGSGGAADRRQGSSPRRRRMAARPDRRPRPAVRSRRSDTTTCARSPPAPTPWSRPAATSPPGSGRRACPSAPASHGSRPLLRAAARGHPSAVRPSPGWTTRSAVWLGLFSADRRPQELMRRSRPRTSASGGPVRHRLAVPPRAAQVWRSGDKTGPGCRRRRPPRGAPGHRIETCWCRRPAGSRRKHDGYEAPPSAPGRRVRPRNRRGAGWRRRAGLSEPRAPSRARARSSAPPLWPSVRRTAMGSALVLARAAPVGSERAPRRCTGSWCGCARPSEPARRLEGQVLVREAGRQVVGQGLDDLGPVAAQHVVTAVALQVAARGGRGVVHLGAPSRGRRAARPPPGPRRRRRRRCGRAASWSDDRQQAVLDRRRVEGVSSTTSARCVMRVAHLRHHARPVGLQQHRARRARATPPAPA